ncbi:ABC transporter ATP-binding protein, partial [bacterium]|nr:ABC transporter ATP-binding protein [bacterium]
KSESKKTELQATKKQTKLSYKEQHDFDTLPDEIEALEEQIRALNACLADPECYQQKGLSTLSESLIACQKEYEEKSDRYLEILEIVESL